MPRYSRYGWRPYVSVAQRQHQAQKQMKALQKNGLELQPVQIEGRKIARTFWGEAWCKHMDKQGDYSNRLPRGRSYVRNGSVCHLAIAEGRIEAFVAGSEVYHVTITVDVLPRQKWENIKQLCSGQIGTLLELLQGKISSSVMENVTNTDHGLFPQPPEINLDCDCPDWATMCKHVAAVLYGVGARLDHQPELLFLLRGVNHRELVASTVESAITQATGRGGGRRRLSNADLSDVFGVEMEADETPTSLPVQPVQKKTAKKRTVQKKADKRQTGKSSQAKRAKKSTAAKAESPKKKGVKKKVTKKTPAKKKAVKQKTASKKVTTKGRVKRKAVTSKKKQAVKKKLATAASASKSSTKKKAK